MPGWAWVLLLLAALPLVHLIALWMERLGWIYWTKSDGHTTRAGNALLELQQVMGPSKRNVIEFKQDKKAVRDDHGDGSPD